MQAKYIHQAGIKGSDNKTFARTSVLHLTDFKMLQLCVRDLATQFDRMLTRMFFRFST